MRRATALLVVVLGFASLAHAQDATGHLVIIGGGSRPPEIMQLITRLGGGAAGHVLVFPQASEVPSTGPELVAEFTALGFGKVTLIGTDRAGADTDAVLRQTDGATAVYFSGGDQARLMDVVRGTKLEARLHELYRGGAVMSGTSAGAAVMSRVMITGDERRPLKQDDNWQTIESDNVVTTTGFGFLTDAIVDQHFMRRRRHNRLISLILEQPALLGIAIDEETATWVKSDRTFEVVGNGPVLVIDGAKAKTLRDTQGNGLRGSDLTMHILRAGAQFDLASRAVVRLSR